MAEEARRGARPGWRRRQPTDPVALRMKLVERLPLLPYPGSPEATGRGAQSLSAPVHLAVPCPLRPEALTNPPCREGRNPGRRG